MTADRRSPAPRRRRPRVSTLVLCGLFVAALALYLLVRPAP
jgi:hypothetical protein